MKRRRSIKRKKKRYGKSQLTNNLLGGIMTGSLLGGGLLGNILTSGLSNASILNGLSATLKSSRIKREEERREEEIRSLNNKIGNIKVMACYLIGIPILVGISTYLLLDIKYILPLALVWAISTFFRARKMIKEKKKELAIIMFDKL